MFFPNLNAISKKLNKNNSNVNTIEDYYIFNFTVMDLFFCCWKNRDRFNVTRIYKNVQI